MNNIAATVNDIMTRQMKKGQAMPEQAHPAFPGLISLRSATADLVRKGSFHKYTPGCCRLNF